LFFINNKIYTKILN